MINTKYFHIEMKDENFNTWPTSGSFFLTGPIWGSTVLRIYIRNMVHIHKVKLHLPHMYMIFILFFLHIKKIKEKAANIQRAHRSQRSIDKCIDYEFENEEDIRILLLEAPNIFG